MGEMEVTLSEEVENRFRNAAYLIYGDEENPIEKAFNEAIEEWAESNS
ncbi:MAG: hypothetical protein ABEJ56_06395 [Candidatus Nanohaloarchaea archaeon]